MIKANELKNLRRAAADLLLKDIEQIIVGANATGKTSVQYSLVDTLRTDTDIIITELRNCGYVVGRVKGSVRNEHWDYIVINWD